LEMIRAMPKIGWTLSGVYDTGGSKWAFKRREN